MHGGACFLQQGAVVRGDAANEMRIDANSIVWKNGKSRGVLHQIQIRGTQRNGQIRRQRAIDAEAPSYVNDVIDTDLVRQLYGWGISGTRQGPAQGDQAFVSFVIVVRGVRLAAAHDREGSIQDGGERSEGPF